MLDWIKRSLLRQCIAYLLTLGLAYALVAHLGFSVRIRISSDSITRGLAAGALFSTVLFGISQVLRWSGKEDFIRNSTSNALHPRELDGHTAFGALLFSALVEETLLRGLLFSAMLKISTVLGFVVVSVASVGLYASKPLQIRSLGYRFVEALYFCFLYLEFNSLAVVVFARLVTEASLMYQTLSK